MHLFDFWHKLSASGLFYALGYEKTHIKLFQDTVYILNSSLTILSIYNGYNSASNSLLKYSDNSVQWIMADYCALTLSFVEENWTPVNNFLKHIGLSQEPLYQY